MYSLPKKEAREIKALRIISVGSHINRKNKLRFKVKSESEDGLWYDVVKQYGHNLGGHQEGQWICTCPDFLFRHQSCKHIFAVGYSKQLKKKIVSPDVVQSSIPQTNNEIICSKCKSSNIVKNGKRHNDCGDLQRYLCRDCKYRFIVNVGFEHSRKNPKIICAAIDLYFKGVSLRKVADHIKQFYEVKIDNTSVLRWIQRFADVVSPFVNSLSPEHLSGIVHVDEMMIHVRREDHEIGHYQWLWNVIDNTTKFWISGIVSQRREIIDARNVYQDVKQKSVTPKAVIHDGLPSYDKAFQKEFFTMKNPRVKNIRSISVRHEGLNSVVERLNGSTRDREKVMRGMNTKESAQKIIEAMRIHYNFCRQHSKLGTSPAVAAGIRLDLKGNKVEGLIRLAQYCHNTAQIMT
jgi:putative transposase